MAILTKIELNFSRDMRLTSIGGGADEVGIKLCFIFVFIFIHALILIVILGNAANHLQNDGNSSKADQKVAHWLMATPILVSY